MPARELTDKNLYQQLWRVQQAHILQSWQWSEIRESLGKWQQHRIVIDERFAVNIAVRKLPLFGRIGYIPRLQIPVSMNQDKLLETIIDFSNQQLHLDLLLIDPAWHKGEFVLPTEMKLAKQIQPQYTNIVNLANKTPEDLWAGLRSSYRRNIKKADRQTVTIEIYSKPEDLAAVKDFYKLMGEVSQNTDFILAGEVYFQRMWRVLSADGLARIYVAKLAEQIIGAYLVAFDELGAYELYGGVNNVGRAVEAGYALKWEAIKDALGLGKQFYDHWGTAPVGASKKLKAENSISAQEKDSEIPTVSYDPKHPLAKISEFKAGFGGENIEFEKQLILVFSNPVYYYYQTLNLGKQILLNIRKLLKR